ncbi:MAG: VOC family protein [Oscillospiraceae bacterium]|nr:VOC family protein [Oscillospiraceae bacterium]
MVSTIMPYLRFHGNCEEAFKFYAECFGSHSLGFSRLNNDPSNPIMHAHLMITETCGIAGSDGDKPKPEMDILVHFNTREEVDAALAKLSAGAKSVSEFAPHPPPDDAGGGAGVVDKYGYSWFLCV